MVGYENLSIAILFLQCLMLHAIHFALAYMVEVEAIVRLIQNLFTYVLPNHYHLYSPLFFVIYHILNDNMSVVCTYISSYITNCLFS